MSDGPVTASLKDVETLIGKIVVLYRNEVKTPARLIAVNKDGEKAGRIVYELLVGPEKGKRFSSKYDDSQTAYVYDDDNKVLALLET